jgi:hypothetical protein
VVIVSFTQKRDVTVLHEGTKLYWIHTAAEYLGLILDKGLTVEKCDKYGLQGFLDL